MPSAESTVLPAFGLPRCSHALPPGNPQLAEDVWKLFWDRAQDLCLRSLLLTTAEMPLCCESATLDFPHTVGDSSQFLARFACASLDL